jgi:hypothetical protein
MIAGTGISARVAAGVTAAYVLDLSRHAAPAIDSEPREAMSTRRVRRGPHAPIAGASDAREGRDGAGLPRRPRWAPVSQSSRRARLGATRGGSSGCLG